MLSDRRPATRSHNTAESILPNGRVDCEVLRANLFQAYSHKNDLQPPISADKTVSEAANDVKYITYMSRHKRTKKRLNARPFT